jgi:type II secretory pathway component GspD/PulD (secretin)
MITANYKEANIRRVIAAVAEFTGKTLVIHPSVQGDVSLEMANGVTADVYYDIFLSLLQTHGYEAVPSEGAIHIVPNGVQPCPGSASAETHNRAGLGDAIRPRPDFMNGINGKMNGMRVYPGSNRSAFDALGFRVGDLIIRFDGLLLADASLANNFLCSLEASTVGYVTIIRDGESTEIQMK